MRVLVTRPEPGATRTAGRLRALGHAPIVAPVLSVEPTGEFPPAGPFDAVLITSGNAVSSLARLGGSAKARPVFALGSRTAALVRKAGFASVVEAGPDAGALAATVVAAMPPASALLHVAGRDRKPEPEASLAAAGHAVTVWAAYAAMAATALPPLVATALVDGRIGAVLHYSRRSAVVLRRLAEAAGLQEALQDAVQICLSADIAEEWSDAPRLIVAAAANEAAMLAALAGLESG